MAERRPWSHRLGQRVGTPAARQVPASHTRPVWSRAGKGATYYFVCFPLLLPPHSQDQYLLLG